MKPLSPLLIAFLLCCGIINAQKDNFLIGKVIKYTKFHNNTHTMVDTITGQFRSLTIDTVAKKVWIQWEIDKVKYPVEYNILKIANTVNFNQTTKKNEPYLSINLKDTEDYPLLIMLTKNLKFFYLYYFWNNAENGFVKSEKIEITERRTISL